MKVTAKQYAQMLFETAKGKKGKDIEQIVARFSLFIIRRRGLRMMKKVMHEIARIDKEHQGGIDATIILAAHDEKSTATVKRELEKKFESEIHLTSVIDPAILGGMILSMNGMRIDASVSHQLETLRNSL